MTPTPKSQKLYVSDLVLLPVDAVTQTFAILGIRGSGKTNTGVVMFEEMVRHDNQCVVLDPTDAWWGVRSSADGKSAGLKVYVFGGPHGDLPLEGGHGVEMANFVIETGASVIFSLRHLSMSDQKRFAAEFGEHIRFLKAKPENRSPLHLFLDEAEEFIPQNIEHDRSGYVGRMFGAYNRMVRRDRNIGLGITIISQRPQSVNKEPLSQIETLVCHRLLHKLDRKNIRESWVEGHDTEGRADQFFNELASLGKGDAWIWSPYWLDIFKKVHIRYRETFDSSFTPKAGEKPKQAKVRAEVDLEQLKAKLSASIEKAKSEDPKELQKTIRQYRAELDKMRVAKAEKVVEVPVEKIVKVEVPHIPDFIFDYLKLMEQQWEEMSGINSTFTKQLLAAKKKGAETATATRIIAAKPITRPMYSQEFVDQQKAKAKVTAESNGTVTGITGPEQRILDAIAWMNSIGVECPSQVAVAFLAGYTYGGGGFNNPRGHLNTMGYIEYRPGGNLRLTDKGKAAANTPGTALTSGELHQKVMSRLPGPEAKILANLINRYPASIPNDDLARMSGYEPGGGGFNNPRGHLKTLELITYPEKGMVRAADILFVD